MKIPYNLSQAQLAHADAEASRLIEALTNAEIWAYWADECSFSDLFPEYPRTLGVRMRFADAVNRLVSDPGSRLGAA